MGVCPGCGRCRQCGQPATVPVIPQWWQTPSWPQPPFYPTTVPGTAPYYTGDPMPGTPGYPTVTC